MCNKNKISLWIRLSCPTGGTLPQSSHWHSNPKKSLDRMGNEFGSAVEITGHP